MDENDPRFLILNERMDNVVSALRQLHKAVMAFSPEERLQLEMIREEDLVMTLYSASKVERTHVQAANAAAVAIDALLEKQNHT